MVKIIVKLLFAFCMGCMLVYKLVDLKFLYYDEMTPYASVVYRGFADFHQRFASLEPHMSLTELVSAFEASYMGTVTSSQLEQRLPSPDCPKSGLGMESAVDRRPYGVAFEWRCYELPPVVDYTGTLVVRCSRDGGVLDYKVTFGGSEGE